MYADTKPCAVCGAPVDLLVRTPVQETGEDPVGPPDGVVGTADPTVDVRRCTNDACASNGPDDRGRPEA